MRAEDRAAFIETGSSYTVPRQLQALEDAGLTPDQVEQVKEMSRVKLKKSDPLSIEGKDELRARGISSPDYGDAFANLFVQTEFVPELGALLATRRPRSRRLLRSRIRAGAGAGVAVRDDGAADLSARAARLLPDSARGRSGRGGLRPAESSAGGAALRSGLGLEKALGFMVHEAPNPLGARFQKLWRSHVARLSLGRQVEVLFSGCPIILAVGTYQICLCEYLCVSTYLLSYRKTHLH